MSVHQVGLENQRASSRVDANRPLSALNIQVPPVAAEPFAETLCCVLMTFVEPEILFRLSLSRAPINAL